MLECDLCSPTIRCKNLNKWMRSTQLSDGFKIVLVEPIQKCETRNGWAKEVGASNFARYVMDKANEGKAQK